MQRDYYAFRRVELHESLRSLDQAAIAFDEARETGDRTARQMAEDQMAQAAQEATGIGPHLAYLWYWAEKEDAEKDARRAANNTERRKAEKEARRASDSANSIRDGWQEGLTAVTIPDVFRFIPDVSAITFMPSLSFMLRIPFPLQKPYISKDERVFYLLDNLLRKEKIFEAPMVAPTSWKGALRSALWQLGYTQTHEVVIRLLGNPRGRDEHQAGRLYFYPTFFKDIGLEVINPHSRETGVGKRGPILMECVPRGTGTLLVLYAPFGLTKQTDLERRAAVARDLEVLAEGVQAMLTTYGFGAKTSSGFGTADNRLAGEGILALRAQLPGMAVPTETTPIPEPVPDLPRYLESPTRLQADFRRPDGSLKLEAEYKALLESRGGKYVKRNRQLYEKAQKWWEREGRQLAEAAAQEPKTETAPTPAATPPISEWTFATLSELQGLAQRVADHLRNGGEV